MPTCRPVVPPRHSGEDGRLREVELAPRAVVADAARQVGAVLPPELCSARQRGHRRHKVPGVGVQPGDVGGVARRRVLSTARLCYHAATCQKQV